jgi:uroporphyrinogen-III synthase
MASVWVTRAQPGAEATAARLRSMGLEPLVAPLLEVRVTAEAAPDLSGVGALAFSSANGVSAFARLSPARDAPVYAVGDATAAAARRAGFAAVRSADGDVAALARLIVADPGRPAGAVLHLCPAEPAGDLVGALAAAGVLARRAALYATLPVEGLPDAVAAAGREGRLDAVLVHSPKAGKTLVALAAAHSWVTGLRAYALSEACAAPLRAAGFAAPRVAPSPREEALLMLFLDGSGDSSQA